MLFRYGWDHIQCTVLLRYWLVPFMNSLLRTSRIYEISEHIPASPSDTPGHLKPEWSIIHSKWFGSTLCDPDDKSRLGDAVASFIRMFFNIWEEKLLFTLHKMKKVQCTEKSNTFFFSPAFSYFFFSLPLPFSLSSFIRSLSPPSPIFDCTTTAFDLGSIGNALPAAQEETATRCSAILNGQSRQCHKVYCPYLNYDTIDVHLCSAHETYMRGSIFRRLVPEFDTTVLITELPSAATAIENAEDAVLCRNGSITVVLSGAELDSTLVSQRR